MLCPMDLHCLDLRSKAKRSLSTAIKNLFVRPTRKIIKAIKNAKSSSSKLLRKNPCVSAARNSSSTPIATPNTPTPVTSTSLMETTTNTPSKLPILYSSPLPSMQQIAAHTPSDYCIPAIKTATPIHLFSTPISFHGTQGIIARNSPVIRSLFKKSLPVDNASSECILSPTLVFFDTSPSLSSQPAMDYQQHFTLMHQQPFTPSAYLIKKSASALPAMSRSIVVDAAGYTSAIDFVPTPVPMSFDALSCLTPRHITTFGGHNEDWQVPSPLCSYPGPCSPVHSVFDLAWDDRFTNTILAVITSYSEEQESNGETGGERVSNTGISGCNNGCIGAQYYDDFEEDGNYDAEYDDVGYDADDEDDYYIQIDSDMDDDADDVAVDEDEVVTKKKDTCLDEKIVRDYEMKEGIALIKYDEGMVNENGALIVYYKGDAPYRIKRDALVLDAVDGASLSWADSVVKKECVVCCTEDIPKCSVDALGSPYQAGKKKAVVYDFLACCTEDIPKCFSVCC